MIRSVLGSQRSRPRPSRIAMLPRWQIVIDRCATSTGAAVGLDRTGDLRPEAAAILDAIERADAPLTILSLHSRTYRGHALRELRRHAAGFSRTGYAARMLWHATGCGRHLHRDLMFWAFRT